MDQTDVDPAVAAASDGGPGVDPRGLVPPVQLAVRCTSCGYERSLLALHQKALEEARRCERCKEPNRVVGHQGGSACACCL